MWERPGGYPVTCHGGGRASWGGLPHYGSRARRGWMRRSVAVPQEHDEERHTSIINIRGTHKSALEAHKDKPQPRLRHKHHEPTHHHKKKIAQPQGTISVLPNPNNWGRGNPQNSQDVSILPDPTGKGWDREIGTTRPAVLSDLPKGSHNPTTP